jgi:hypothetical protein
MLIIQRGIEMGLPPAIWKRGAFLLPLTCLAMLLGCSKVNNSSEIVGKYEAHHQNGVETLELRSDGTYTHQFKSSNGNETVYSASWKLDPCGGESKVFLDHFAQHFPGSSQTGPIGTLLGVEKRWGRIRLYLSYDRDQYYT